MAEGIDYVTAKADLVRDLPNGAQLLVIRVER
jgi:hypothetical protein